MFSFFSDCFALLAAVSADRVFTEGQLAFDQQFQLEESPNRSPSPPMS
jgi:hypothetical protein